MADVPAIASGPIFFLDTATGKQISLPLRNISFSNGIITARGAIYTAYQTLLDKLLPHLASTGLIVPGAPPPVQPVMALRAKQPGANGNFIVAEFKGFDYTDPENPEFDATVSETNTYEGLKPDTIQQVLGSAASGTGVGSRPGLVIVPGAAPAPTDIPAAGVYPLVDNAGTAEVAVPLDAGGGDAFTLRARAAGADGALTSAEVKAVDTTAGTFTLVVTWKKQTSGKIESSEVSSTFDYELEVTPPEGASSVGAPVPGSYVLSGGADATGASKASTVLAG